MATCLRCDNCSKVVAEYEDGYERWWRITRYGADWITEPGAPPMDLAPILHTEFSFAFDEDEGTAEEDESMLLGGIGGGGFGANAAIVHLCSNRCLADWASQAAALEE